MVKRFISGLSRSSITTTLELIGAVLVVIGVSSFSVAAGLIAGGVILIGIGYLTA